MMQDGNYVPSHIEQRFRRQGSWLFPPDETHLPQMLREDQYQQRQRTLSLEGMTRFRTAIDVGANVGLWTRELGEKFQRVIAFEPIEEFRTCLLNNVHTANIVILAECLGNQAGEVAMTRVRGNAGHTHIDPTRKGTTPISRLDDHAFTEVDYIKIDCEGYEFEVLEGAEQTIRRERPRLIVECKPHLGKDQQYRSRDLILSWGYRLRPYHGDDLVFEYAD